MPSRRSSHTSILSSRRWMLGSRVWMLASHRLIAGSPAWSLESTRASTAWSVDSRALTTESPASGRDCQPLRSGYPRLSAAASAKLSISASRWSTAVSLSSDRPKHGIDALKPAAAQPLTMRASGLEHDRRRCRKPAVASRRPAAGSLAVRGFAAWIPRHRATDVGCGPSRARPRPEESSATARGELGHGPRRARPRPQL